MPDDTDRLIRCWSALGGAQSEWARAGWPGGSRGWVGASGLSPEVGRVVGEGVRMTQGQLVVARCRAAAPLLGFPMMPRSAEGAGEPGCVPRVVAGGRQGAEAADGGLVVAQ